MKNFNLGEIKDFKNAFNRGETVLVATAMFDGTDRMYTVQEHTAYRSGFLDIVKNGELVANTSSEVVPGITNFSNNKIDADSYFLVDEARILWETKAGSKAKGLLEADWNSPAPKNFKNGEISISQNKTGMNVSGADFTVYDDASDRIAKKKLKTPLLIRPALPFSAVVSLSKPATVDQLYNLQLSGYLFTAVSATR